jgi:hypothetical protein
MRHQRHHLSCDQAHHPVDDFVNAVTPLLDTLDEHTRRLILLVEGVHVSSSLLPVSNRDEREEYSCLEKRDLLQNSVEALLDAHVGWLGREKLGEDDFSEAQARELWAASLRRHAASCRDHLVTEWLNSTIEDDYLRTVYTDETPF